MNCPHCNAVVDAGARFCGACGNAAIATSSVAVPPSSVDPYLALIGREIAGRYRIVAKLGEGGMGAVFRADQFALKRTCAVKLLRPEVSSNPQLVRRFNAEAQAVAQLKHPNTVVIYDFGQDTDGSLYIAMEFVDGTSLRKVVTGGPLHPRRALAIAAQVAASLTDAHARSIVHRDLKPDNVMLEVRGKQRDIARVLDFGIAKLRDDSRATQQAMTQAGDMLGTPQYMAPEQIRGGDVDGRCDVYALGCMIYEMVTGRMPFEADAVMAILTKHLMEPVVPPTQRRPDLALPPQLDALVLAAMAKEPSQRPPTMEIYGEMIATTLAMMPPDPDQPMTVATGGGFGPPSSPYAPNQPYTAPPYSPQQPPPQMPTAPPTAHAKSGNRTLWIVLGIVVVLAGGGIFAALEASGGGGGDTPAKPDKPDKPDRPDKHDDVVQPDKPKHDDVVKPDKPDKPDAPEDPWNRGSKNDTETGTMLIPDDFTIDLPVGFTAQGTQQPTLQHYVDTNAGLEVLLYSLDPGTNNVKLLTDKVQAAFKKAQFQRFDHVYAGGANREAAWLRVTANNGADLEVLVVYFIQPDDDIRVGAMINMASAAYQRDPNAGAKTLTDLAQRVHVP